MKKTLILIAVAVATLCSSEAYAQRTAEGEMGVYVSYTHPFMKGWGAVAGWNLYTLYGIWDASVSITGRAFVFEGAVDIPASHYTVRGGYLFRLCSTRDRSLNLYAGGGVLYGLGTFGLLDRLDGIAKDYGLTFSESDYGTNPYSVFGFYPKVECEYFFSDSVCLDVSFQMPLTFHDDKHPMVQKLTGIYCPEVSAGFKVNF